MAFGYRAASAYTDAVYRRFKPRAVVDMSPEEFAKVIAVVRPALKRGMTPLQVALSKATASRSPNLSRAAPRRPKGCWTRLVL